MATTAIQTIMTLDEIAICGNSDGLINLTAIHKASKTGAKKNPAHFFRLDTTVDFLTSLAENLNVQISTLRITKRGGTGTAGSWSHWQVALAYASWISPEFHILVNEGFREWAEEHQNPDLKIDRAIEAWRRRNRSQEWIEDRLAGKSTRRRYTDALKAHGVEEQYVYIAATQLATEAATGKTADQIKRDAGVPAKTSARDAMNRRDLKRLELIESEIAHRLELEGAQGQADCLRISAEEAKRFGEFFGTAASYK